MATKGPTKKGDRWYLDKDPDEKSFYAADVTQELADRGTTAASVAPVIAGVTVLIAPVIQTITVGGMQRTYVVIKLGGFDVTGAAENFWTARVTCANGEEFDKTTWFNRVDT
jgi:hypothetical protein